MSRWAIDDRDHRREDDREHDRVHDGQLLALADVAEDQQRQRVLGAGGEVRDDDLVEREREREQPAGDQRGRDHRQRHEAERLPAVGAEVRRRLEQRAATSAAAARARCCRRSPRRTSRARSRSSRARGSSPPVTKNELSAIPVMIPGSAIGSTNTNEIVSRPKNLKRWIANAAAAPSIIAIAAREQRRLEREHERVPHLLVVERDAEPVRREAGDRPALHVRAVERVDHDQDQRQPEEQRSRAPSRPAARCVCRAVSITGLERAERCARPGGRRP